MPSQRILLLLGGTWHQFDAFEAMLRGLLEPAGHEIYATRNLDILKELQPDRFDLVIMYTCFSQTLEDKSPATVLFRDDHAIPLAAWIAQGKGLLMVHSACVSCQTSPVLRKLAGGEFVSHPPAFSFMVHPMFNPHPITAGVLAFGVFDEFYIENIEPDVSIHMVAVDRGVAYPMVWTRRDGAGRVAHIAMGHDDRVWRLPQYQQLLRQSIDWLAAVAE